MIIDTRWWYILAITFLIAEISTGTFFLLIPCISFTITGVICSFLNIETLYLSSTIFIVITGATIISTSLLYNHFPKRTKSQIDVMDQFLGSHTILLEKIDIYKFRIKLGDSYWNIIIEEDIVLNIGDMVTITGYKGIVFTGKKFIK